MASIEPQQHEVTVQQVLASMHTVPDANFFPEILPAITLCDEEDDDNNDDNNGEDLKYFYRSPSVEDYVRKTGTTTIADEFLSEVNVNQLIRDNPHPNLGAYDGCTTKRGRLFQLVYTTTATDLKGFVDSEGIPSKADQVKWMKQLRAAADRLHSLGVSHNDIYKAAVKIDGNRDAILWDFHSCRKFGETIGELRADSDKEGTAHSSIENDKEGLAEVEQYLADPTK